MKNIFLLIIVASLLYNCNVEEKSHYYTTAIRNTSDEPFHILVLGDTLNRNQPVYDTLINTTLQAGQSTKKHNYSFSSFMGLNPKYYIYYAKIKFENDRGYICDNDPFNMSLCFLSKSSFIVSMQESDFTFENGIYYYDITQGDYENAHNLE